jgi:hypothetical protein
MSPDTAPATSLPRRTALAALISLASLPLGACAAPAQTLGALADITIRDRDSGETLPTYQHRGRWYVAGRPGARYAIALRNNTGGRLLTVMSVDGVNVVTGQTAAWQQSGYVFDPYQRYEIAGWRKSDSEIAAFEFTALADSYAARTGRPAQVGAIGVALFRERVAEPPVSQLRRGRPDDLFEQRAEAAADSATGSGASPGASPGASLGASNAAAPPPAAAPAAKGAAESDSRAAAGALGALTRPAPESKKLGTGHGQREHSVVESTHFVRASSTPDETVTLYYDSRENLVAQGVIPSPRAWPPRLPQPFPDSPSVGYAADPPPR